ncbi:MULTISPECIES: hypothetical protein [unclassified Nocardiopsis]|uniref:hypothetical protein n=1 Tax=Nocardiopsis TaxID=2013 RepID=UPI00387AB83B
MATPRRTAAALTAAALTLILAACSSSPGNPADAPGADETSLGRGGVPQASSPAPPPSDGAGETDLPSHTVRVGGVESVVVVGPVRRTGGELADLTVAVHVVGESGVHAADLAGWLEDSELVDTENGRVHRVARDGDGVCVCSRAEEVYLLQGDVLVLSATFAAPPEGMDAIDVRLVLGGTFPGVPVV